MPLKLKEFDYALPDHLIAREPVAGRDQSRLLVLNREKKSIRHRRFSELEIILRPNDVLVLNDSKVIPARLRGKKNEGRGAVEILLLEEKGQNLWWGMLKPGKRMPAGSTATIFASDGLKDPIQLEVREKHPNGRCLIRFRGTENILENLNAYGEVPLPPYIGAANRRSFDDANRYQTVYAQHRGSVAAPTAGLHFSETLLKNLQKKGISLVPVTLHVGLGTFAPVKAPRIADHFMHEETFELSAASSTALTEAKAQGRRIVAVGTTSVRVLETVAAANQGKLLPQQGRTKLFLYPPCEFRFVDALITNFHLPKSSLLMLVSAFASPKKQNGIELIRQAYTQAIRQNYRFFSYGDAMFIQ